MDLDDIVPVVDAQMPVRAKRIKYEAQDPLILLRWFDRFSGWPGAGLQE